MAALFLMMLWPLPADTWWPAALYHALLRLMIASGVAAFAVLSIRMLRAHLHLAERNRHHLRVANSITSVLNSALEPQQRELILAKLVAALVELGNSDLNRHERDELSSPTLSADGIGRILGAITSKW